MIAQEQALSRRSIEAGVYCTREDPRFRLCKDAPDNPAPNSRLTDASIDLHNQVVSIIYGNICAEYDLEVLR